MPSCAATEPPPDSLHPPSPRFALLFCSRSRAWLWVLHGIAGRCAQGAGGAVPGKAHDRDDRGERGRRRRSRKGRRRHGRQGLARSAPTNNNNNNPRTLTACCLKKQKKPTVQHPTHTLLPISRFSLSLSHTHTHIHTPYSLSLSLSITGHQMADRADLEKCAVRGPLQRRPIPHFSLHPTPRPTCSHRFQLC